MPILKKDLDKRINDENMTIYQKLCPQIDKALEEGRRQGLQKIPFSLPVDQCRIQVRELIKAGYGTAGWTVEFDSDQREGNIVFFFS
jgi:hypothetical protein